MKNKLVVFLVQGWVKETDAPRAKRIPLSRPERVSAIDGLTAAKTYARCHGVRESSWLNTWRDPLVVICTEKID